MRRLQINMLNTLINMLAIFLLIQYKIEKINNINNYSKLLI
jgi:putative effector of murein hydrolase LrgA (UPF0299 family)